MNVGLLLCFCAYGRHKWASCELNGVFMFTGDIMGPALSDIDELVLLPMGCGEQNMVHLAPNVAILQYLSATGQLTDDIEVKTLNHLHKGTYY